MIYKLLSNILMVLIYIQQNHRYRKTNVVSGNRNENVEITVKEADIIRKQILAKFEQF